MSSTPRDGSWSDERAFASHGFGLFADKDFKKDEKIIQYTGEIIDEKEFLKLWG